MRGRYLPSMNTAARELSRLWEIATQIRGDEEDYGDRRVAEAVAWALPGAEICGVHSRPIGALEFYAVRVGGMVVGGCGAWPVRDFPSQARKMGFVHAPCILRSAGQRRADGFSQQIASRLAPYCERLELAEVS